MLVCAGYISHVVTVKWFTGAMQLFRCFSGQLCSRMNDCDVKSMRPLETPVCHHVKNIARRVSVQVYSLDKARTRKYIIIYINTKYIKYWTVLSTVYFGPQAATIVSRIVWDAVATVTISLTSSTACYNGSTITWQPCCCFESLVQRGETELCVCGCSDTRCCSVAAPMEGPWSRVFNPPTAWVELNSELVVSTHVVLHLPSTPLHHFKQKQTHLLTGRSSEISSDQIWRKWCEWKPVWTWH